MYKVIKNINEIYKNNLHNELRYNLIVLINFLYPKIISIIAMIDIENRLTPIIEVPAPLFIRSVNSSQV